MCFLEDLHRLPSASDFLERIEHYEQLCRAQHLRAGDLTLSEGGALSIENETYPIAHHAREDLAHLAKIPTPFFAQLDPDLQAVVFGQQFAKEVSPEEDLSME